MELIIFTLAKLDCISLGVRCMAIWCWEQKNFSRLLIGALVLTFIRPINTFLICVYYAPSFVILELKAGPSSSRERRVLILVYADLSSATPFIDSDCYRLFALIWLLILVLWFMAQRGSYMFSSHTLMVKVDYLLMGQ